MGLIRKSSLSKLSFIYLFKYNIMDKLTQSQIDEIDKIQFQIAELGDKSQQDLYTILRSLCIQFPNNPELAIAIRSLI